MLLIGCQGGTNATSGVVPEVTRKIFDLTAAGQIEAARRLQFRLIELFDVLVYGADFPKASALSDLNCEAFIWDLAGNPFRKANNRSGRN